MTAANADTPAMSPARRGLLQRVPARLWLGGLIVGVCALASAGIWLGPGILNTRAGGDSPFLLQRTFELASNLRAGAVPARWMPDGAYGLGYPFFHFYAALPYYLAAGLNLLGFDLLAAIKLTQTAGMFAAAGAMVLYARRRLPPAGAALAAIAYVLVPFHLVNVYVRGDSLSEFYAFVWFPLILWAVDRVVGGKRQEVRGQKSEVGGQKQEARGERKEAGSQKTAGGRTKSEDGGRAAVQVVVLAGCLAGLVVTHNISLLLFAPFVTLYALAMLAIRASTDRHDGAPQPVRSMAGAALRLALAAALGAALSAWFWLPALGDANQVQLGKQTSGYFNYANHFRAADLVQPRLAFDYSVTDSLSPFAMGLAQAVLVLLGTAITLHAYRRDRPAWLAFATIAVLCALATFMITPLSKAVWDAVPGLPLAQFPWRYLSVQAVFAAVLIGGAMGRRKDEGGRMRPFILHPSAFILFLVLLLVQSLPGLPNERLDIRAEDVTPESLKRYEWFTGNIGTTIRAEYLPATVQPRPLVGPDVLGKPRQAWPVAGAISGSALEVSEPARQVWRVDVASQTATVTLPLIYWPAWRAKRLDTGEPVALSAFVGSGWVQLALPRGRQRVELWLDATPLQRAGEWISAIAAVAVIGALIVMVARKRRWVDLTARSVVLAAVAILILALVAWVVRLLDPPQPPPIQTMDFVGRPFPHRAPVVFRGANGESYTLTGATVSPPAVRGSEPFTLTTAWQAGQAPAQVGLEQELPSGGYFALLFRFARDVTYGDPGVSAYTALTNALPGPLLLKLRALDAAGNVLTPTVPSANNQGGAILDGLNITAGNAPLPGGKIRTFPNGIVLHSIDWFNTSAQEMCLRPVWSTGRPQVAALKVALRLRGVDGREIASADGEPQAGLAPTWSWPIGAPVSDNYCVPVTGNLKPGEPYTLLVRWYRAMDEHVEGEVTLVGRRADGSNDLNVPQPVITQHSSQVPVMQTPSQLAFGEAIRLLGYDVVTGTSALSLTLHWQAAQPVDRDYKLFVHLSPLDTAEPVAQADRHPLDGRYPTGMWLLGEVVSDTATLDLRAVAPGRYRLAVGWYDPDTLHRLPATDGGQAIADGWAVLTTLDR